MTLSTAEPRPTAHPTDIPATAGSRAARARQPLATNVLKEVAADYRVCLRPIPVRRIDATTGESTVLDIPCGATLASVCPTCAEKARRLRIAQCQQGWHLDAEPEFTPDPPTDEQRVLVELRSTAHATRETAALDSGDTGEQDATLDAIDREITRAGVRGSLDTGGTRRVRSTRRRQDAPDLPRRTVENRTVGRVFPAGDGPGYRPSMFLTLTCDTYGKVRPDGTPVDPDRYDYRRAARDAIHFGKLVDRFIQNLRRVAGYDVQYFATVEPQRRLAPHLHAAIRGAIPRADLRLVAAATYHQVWWPNTDTPVYIERMPEWDDEQAAYLDPDTGAALPTWDEALDAIGDEDEPAHVVRFGPQVDAQGVLAGSPDANRCITYLAKYLNKSIADCHTAESASQRAHVDRLAAVLRYEPCSPTCPNWLRYGVQPKNARAGMRPGCCRAKTHRRTHLGYGGRRVLVSRKWTGKTLDDHKQDRRAWIAHMLGHELEAPADPRAYVWQIARPTDTDVPSLNRRLMKAVAQRIAWRQQLDTARGTPPPTAPDLSAINDKEAA